MRQLRTFKSIGSYALRPQKGKLKFSLVCTLQILFRASVVFQLRMCSVLMHMYGSVHYK